MTEEKQPLLTNALIPVIKIGQGGLLLSGNKCGHSPIHPRCFLPPETHKPRPFIIEEAKQKLNEFYKRPQHYLKHIVWSRSSTRQQRTEAREAILMVGQTLLHYLHLATMQIGVYNTTTGEFRHFSNQFLAEKAGVGEKRFERALQALSKAGYIKLDYRLIISPEGIKRPLTSIKKLSKLFIQHLDISDLKLSRAFEHAHKQWNRVLSGISEASNAVVKRFKSLFTQQPNSFKKEESRAVMETVKPKPQAPPFDFKAHRLRYLEFLKKHHTNLTLSELEARLPKHLQHL